jgi:hypothetical protein
VHFPQGATCGKCNEKGVGFDRYPDISGNGPSPSAKFVAVVGCGRGIFGKMLDIPFGRQHKGVAILSVP